MIDVRLSAAAEADIVDILSQTYEDFGNDAGIRYQWLIATALADLAADFERNGSLQRPEIGPNVRSYHLRHSRERARLPSGVVRRPRHLILFRQVRPTILGVGRLLHDAMDLNRHVPGAFGDE
jgi:toxin ParE1/3/4